MDEKALDENWAHASIAAGPEIASLKVGEVGMMNT